MSSDTTIEEFLAMCRSDFITFASKVFIELNSGNTFKANWSHDAISHVLKQVQDGHERRLILNASPRSLKSTIASVAWPAYLLGHDPTLEIMCISHNLALAAELAFQFRKIVKSVWYREVFPHMAAKPETDNETTFRTSQGGVRHAVSVGSGITGLGADILVIDDPIDTDHANNPDACATTNNWIAKTLMSRLNDKTTGRIILVMQRVSIHDTTAFFLGKEQWKLLSLPAKTDVDREIPLFDGNTYHWKQGELLHPEFLPEAELQRQRNYMGVAAYNAQYLQRPIPSGGGHIDLSLFRRFEDLPQECDRTLISVDAASGMKSGSQTAVQVWRYANGQLYLQALGVGYWAFPDTVKTVFWAIDKFNADHVLVEHASSGAALLEELDAKYPHFTHPGFLQAIRPRLGKVERMAKAMLMVEQGRVHLPADAPWLEKLEQELQGFPEAALNDQVDAMSQAINWIQDLERPVPEATVTLLHRHA